jgi:hypothetical protein
MDTSVDALSTQRRVCAELSCSGDLVLTLASAAHVHMVFNMVNTAYKVEDGDTGVAFKKTDRFLAHDEGD